MPSSTTENTRSARVPGSRAALIWGVIATVLVTVATVGVFLVAPEDADQGVIQRIFYFHVSIALFIALLEVELIGRRTERALRRVALALENA